MNHVKIQCDADFQKLDQIIKFDLSQQSNPASVRDSYIQVVIDAYGPACVALNLHISYSLHRSADFQRLDQEARSVFQSINDQSASIRAELEKHREDAAKIIKDIREVAAEQGVTQQAIYFQNESAEHDKHAETWEMRTISVAATLFVFAVLALFLHKWSWIAPTNTFETVQMVSSKLLIFGVLTCLLVLCAKNYLNHKHNSIVNKHRQNALMTYKAMVDATGDLGSHEAILIQAASCIFNPQSAIRNPQSAIRNPQSAIHRLCGRR